MAEMAAYGLLDFWPSKRKQTQVFTVHYKGLESDPSNSPPAQEDFTAILIFDWIQTYFLF